MSRKGEHAEIWGDEHIKGSRTINSGAVFGDADRKTAGFGGRMYEIKSSEVNAGIKISKQAVDALLFKSNRELRDPVFIYMNKHYEVFAILPMKTFLEGITSPSHGKDARDLFSRMLFYGYAIRGRGYNISVKEKTLKKLDEGGVLTYIRKDEEPWAIVEAEKWLDCIGDLKETTDA